MAARLEKAFGADGRELLDRQAAFDRHGRQGEERRIAVAPHVPDFLTVTARQIQGWADGNIEARHLLPVLLRKLVHATGSDLRRVDFPGHDDAERPGWDGRIEAGAATPWVPEGRSGWEFGAGKDPSRKAERDHEARLHSVPPSERAEYAFVFVTPRNWPGKNEWARDKRAAGDWKDVRALDASDLEQWLDGSIHARMWFAEKLGLPVAGFETLDACWRRWAEASEPRMTPALFAPALAAYRGALRDWLDKTPDRPFTVAAESKDEALAFLSCLFEEDCIDARWRDLAAVFGSAEPLRKLAASNAPFLPIVHADAAEHELAAVYRQRHCIAVRPRNAVVSRPDVALDLLDHAAFDKALAEMGVEEARVDRLGRESGRSPTILRRRLSNIPAIRTPEWAGDPETARRLIPMTLVGAWRATARADREIVSFWGNEGYERIEESVARLLRLDDCPVWSVGQYRGVASKIDALFAIAGYMTRKDVDDFFFLAEHVLSETDPALELPEGKRWAAGLYDKLRDHSEALREGVGETLVILSVHGNDLFRVRLGIDVEAHVSMLVRRLLTPLTLDKLLSHENDLPHYAEAAPGEFLKLIETDLRRPEPVVLGLLKPVEGGMFGRCLRTHLLWALECLAWKHLGRAGPILARLSEISIEDNWLNKPIASLDAIYRCWMPQTAASLEERMQSLEMLTKQFPDIGWNICMAQLATGPQAGFHSHRPRWRVEPTDVGRSVTREEIHIFRRKALDLALAWPEHDSKTLGDLLELVREVSDEDGEKIWSLIDTWTESETDEKAKANLRERIRRFAFTRRGWSNLDDGTRDRARSVYAKLEPSDPVIRHASTFSGHWIGFSTEDLENEELDYDEHWEKIWKLRNKAMKEVWEERGFNGVMALLSTGGPPDIVGFSLTSAIRNTAARIDFLLKCLSVESDSDERMDGCIRGFLQTVDDCTREAIVESAVRGVDIDKTARLLRCAPFRQHTWRLLDRYGDEVRDRYWREVVPQWNHFSDTELNELVDHLLAAKRPYAAFDDLNLDWSRIGTSRLKRLLFEAGTENPEPEGRYRVDAHQISEALSALDGRSGVTLDEMVHLEFMFLNALRWSKHDIPNLERLITGSPISFVQMLALAFRRTEDEGIPPEWLVQDPERRDRLASSASELLRRINRIPGTMEGGEIDVEALFSWVTEARRLCAKYGCTETGDRYIGRLLSGSPAEKDGSWPCLPVCEAIQRIASPEMNQGFLIGTCSSRGVTTRAIGEGGAQERELAAKYRRWAELRRIDYPHVGTVLENIAVHYDRQAAREDDEAKVEARLEY